MSATPQPQRSETRTVEFKGRTRADAKRRALNFWYMNKRKLGLDVRGFMALCRLQTDGRTIVFYPAD